MTSKAVAKRPIVFTWAEINKYPTLEARYAETLPIKHNPSPCYCNHQPEDCDSCMSPSGLGFVKRKAQNIKRTAERWAWFSGARDIDDERGERLGTLGYLPWEIRQEIIGYLFGVSFYPIKKARDWKFTGYTSEAYRRSTFNFHSMGLASPSTKSETEHYYLTKTKFHFSSPEHLRIFLDDLSIYQQSLLRSFSVDWWVYWDQDFCTSSWIAAFADLPPNLVSMEFCPIGNATVVREIKGHWFTYCARFDRAQRLAEYVNAMAKCARRHAPRAMFSLYIRGRRSNVEPAAEEWIRVFDDLEPWSKNWLEWWEEENKLDLDGGEEADNTASAPDGQHLT